MTEQTWTVIKFLRDRALPRFRLFEGETWTTYRPVGEVFGLGAGQLEMGRDFKIVYRGSRSGAELTNIEDFFFLLSVGDKVEVRLAGERKSRTYTVEVVDAKKPRFTGKAPGQRVYRTIEFMRDQSGSRVLAWTPSFDSAVVTHLRMA